MKKILKLAEVLSELRAQESELKSKLAPIKERKLATQEMLIEAMKEMGLKSVKTDEHTFSRVVKKDITVYDQSALIKALQKNGIKDDYVHEQVDVLKFKGYAKQLLKNTGELLDGTEPTESEYMSIRAAK